MATVKQLFLITALAVLILINWQQAQADQTQKVVYVNSTEQCQKDYQCNNFTYLLSAIFTSNTAIHFLQGSHLATASLKVSNITNLVLTGPEVSPDKPPVAHIVINGEVFGFENVSNLTLQYLIITHKQCISLQLYSIHSIVMNNVHIVGNEGYGLHAHNIRGNFSIINCKFLNNSRENLYWYCNDPDGGNAKITYDNDSFSDVKHNILQIFHSEFGYGESSSFGSGGLYIEVVSLSKAEQYYLSVTVSDCIFYNNKSPKGANMRFDLPVTNYLTCTISVLNSLFVNGTAEYGAGGLHTDYSGSENSTADVYITNSTFLRNVARQSYGGGLSMEVLSMNFFAYINASNFVGNEVSEYQEGGGGGMHLRLILLPSPLQNGTKVVVFNTTFKGNKAGSAFTDYRVVNGDGGGLYLFISGSNFREIVVFRYCSFKDNIAHRGGGIAISSQSSNQLVIEECSFVDGIALMGGAVSILPQFNRGPFRQQLVTILESHFLNNSANLGGAVYLNVRYISPFIVIKGSFFLENSAMSGGVVYFEGKSRGEVELSIIMDQCKLWKNYALYGAGLTIASYYRGNISTVINECQIQDNKAEYSIINITSSNYNIIKNTLCIEKSHFFDNQVSLLQYKTSTVYLLHVSKCYINNTIFSNNFGSCLLANHSNISLEGDVVFRGNTAFAGAAVLMDCPPDSLQPSFLNLLPNSNVIITNNTALHSGGGIAINPECNYDSLCFFQSSLINPIIQMESNLAAIAGNSIYGPLIEYCTEAENIIGFAAFSGLFEVVHSMPGDVILAENYELCFCGVDSELCNTNLKIEVHSGQEFNISVVITRPFQDLSDISFIRSNILTTKPALLGPLQDIQELRRICGNLTFSVMASASTIAQIELSIEFAPTAHNSYVNITVLDCPIGFKLDDEFVCNCDPYLTSTIQLRYYM